MNGRDTNLGSVSIGWEIDITTDPLTFESLQEKVEARTEDSVKKKATSLVEIAFSVWVNIINSILSNRLLFLPNHCTL
jgi:hypothetical protein